MRLIKKVCVLISFGLAALGIVSLLEVSAAEPQGSSANPNLIKNEGTQNQDEVNSTPAFTSLYEIVTTPSAWSTPAKVLVGVAIGGAITYAYMKYMNDKKYFSNTESKIVAELIKINQGIEGIHRSINGLGYARTGYSSSGRH